MITKKMTIGRRDYARLDEGSDIHKMYEKIAKTLPMFQETDLQKAKIAFVLVYPNVSRTCVARVIRASPQLRFLGDLDFVIEISGELWETLPLEVKEIVMEHEMLHMACVYDKNGDPKFGLVDHNVKDFYCILEKYGINWFTELREKFVKLYAGDSGVKEGDDPETQNEKAEKHKKKKEDILARLKL
jgi:predicted metallopeptidase